MQRRLYLLIPGIVIAAAVLIALPHLMTTDYTRQLLNQALIYIVIVVGYNFVTGDVGQLSMAQQGFFAVGAYTTAILTTSGGWPWWAGLLASMVVCGGLGIVVGIPTLKVRGQYIIMVTMAFSEIIRLIATNWKSLTGGASGIPKVPFAFALRLHLREQGQHLLPLPGHGRHLGVDRLAHSEDEVRPGFLGHPRQRTGG